MSTTTADILAGITRLIDALDELLKTQTVEALVDLVRQLGIGEAVKSALQALTGVLDLITSWIAKLEQVAAIPRLLENLEPAFEGMHQLADSSGEELRQMGMEPLAPLADASRAALALLEKLRAGATAILQGFLPEESLKQLRASVTDITATLKTLGERLVQAPAKPVSPTPGKAALAAGGAT
ncbi:hypothetical protein [Pyxidicoccus trucidator]|uniref:hypothetical protein n=1 Tax=Pyxidicoccus trucidator TaxID=2709662 RepID=UPI0013DCA6F8|nr:hypothetical protein [Pyxidicoccus trucidator]